MNFDIGPGSNIFDYLVFFDDYDNFYVVFLQKTGKLSEWPIPSITTFNCKMQLEILLSLSEDFVEEHMLSASVLEQYRYGYIL